MLLCITAVLNQICSSENLFLIETVTTTNFWTQEFRITQCQETLLKT